MAYNFLLSFFPFLIFLMTLIGYSGLKSEQVLMLLQDALKDTLPHNTYDLVNNIVAEVVNYKRGSLLSLSILITIWVASSGIGALIKGLNKAYDEAETRNYFKIQIISILCTISLAFIIIITLFLLVFGQLIGAVLASELGLTEVFTFLWDIVRYGIVFFSMIFAFSAIYRYIPCRKLTWSNAAPGACFATAGWIIVSIGFAYYVNNFGSYSKLYGSIGAVIVLLIWLFLESVIMIVGGEINATLVFDRERRQKTIGKRY